MHPPVLRRTFLHSLGALGAAALAQTRAPSAFGASPQNAPTYRVALIGHTGRGAFGHGLDTMWAKVARTSVVALADAASTPQATAALPARFPGATFFSDYRQMLQEVRPEIVAICPRHVDQHADMAIAAAKAGVRGVYMEKPFVRSLGEAEAVERACSESGMRLALAHRNRYHPVLPVLVQLLAEGKFGRLLEMRARGKEDRRGGALDLWVLGSHVLNLATVFGGEPRACTAGLFQDGRPVTREDVQEGDEGLAPLAGNAVHARFEMETGVPLFFDSVKDAGSKSAGFGLQLICSEAVVDLRADTEPAAHVRTGNPFRPSGVATPWIPVTSGGMGRPEPLENIQQLTAGHGLPAADLLDAIEQKRDPLCGLAAGKTSVAMISAVFESHRLGSRRVEFPLQTRVNPLTLL